VFRHHHHPETLAERIDQLMVAVFWPDDRERLSRLAEHLAPDFVYINPSAVYEGAEGLSDAYTRFRHESWRHTTLRRTTVVDVHHAHFRYAWKRTDSDGTTNEGWTFGWMDAAGKIARLVAFDGLMPVSTQKEEGT
jgi:hypothetical protein